MILLSKMRTLIPLLLSCFLAAETSSQSVPCQPKICPNPEKFLIDLDMDAYYSEALASTLTGELFKAKLNEKTQSQHKRYSYSSDCVWIAISEADSQNSKNETVIATYSRRVIPVNNRDCGEKLQNNNWNREHVWAKSHGFGKQKSSFAYSDLHHLVASDKSVNSERDTRDFKEGGNNKEFYACTKSLKKCYPNTNLDTDCGECELDCTGCKSIGNNEKAEVYSFEPPDIVKGQIARIMFYMDTRYDGSDISGNLTLVNNKTVASEGDGKFGYLSDLLKWHCKFPVTDRELHRNDIVQSWQGNRNPFVDRPDFVERIWGSCPAAITAQPDSRPTYSPVPQPTTAQPTINLEEAKVWINEFHYDNAGSDKNEFIEIGCNGIIDVTGYKIILYNGKRNSRKFYDEKILEGVCTPTRFVFQDYFPSQGIQNGKGGPDGIALVDANRNVLEFVSYGRGVFTALDGDAKGMTSVDIGVEESSRSTENDSLQLEGRGCKKEDFTWKVRPSRSSKGFVNTNQEIFCNYGKRFPKWSHRKYRVPQDLK